MKSVKNEKSPLTIIAIIVLSLVILAMAFAVIAGITGIFTPEHPVDTTEPTCDHVWATVYYKTDYTLKRCLNCGEKKIDIVSHPDPISFVDKTCKHINYELISQPTFDAYYSYKCKDCGNTWKIYSSEITDYIIEENDVEEKATPVE